MVHNHSKKIDLEEMRKKFNNVQAFVQKELDLNDDDAIFVFSKRGVIVAGNSNNLRPVFLICASEAISAIDSNARNLQNNKGERCVKCHEYHA